MVVNYEIDLYFSVKSLKNLTYEYVSLLIYKKNNHIYNKTESKKYGNTNINVVRLKCLTNTVNLIKYPAIINIYFSKNDESIYNKLLKIFNKKSSYIYKNKELNELLKVTQNHHINILKVDENDVNYLYCKNYDTQNKNTVIEYPSQDIPVTIKVINNLFNNFKENNNLNIKYDLLQCCILMFLCYNNEIYTDISISNILRGRYKFEINKPAALKFLGILPPQIYRKQIIRGEIYNLVNTLKILKLETKPCSNLYIDKYYQVVSICQIDSYEINKIKEFEKDILNFIRTNL